MWNAKYHFELFKGVYTWVKSEGSEIYVVSRIRSEDEFKWKSAIQLTLFKPINVLANVYFISFGRVGLGVSMETVIWYSEKFYTVFLVINLNTSKYFLDIHGYCLQWQFTSLSPFQSFQNLQDGDAYCIQ